MSEKPDLTPLEILRFEKYSEAPDLVRIASVLHENPDTKAVVDYARELPPEAWISPLLAGEVPFVEPSKLKQGRRLFLGQHFPPPQNMAVNWKGPALINFGSPPPDGRYPPCFFEWCFDGGLFYSAKAEGADFEGASFKEARSGRKASIHERTGQRCMKEHHRRKRAVS